MLSAVVISYNEAAILEITLPPILESVDQVVIVDMESTDGSDRLYKNLLRPQDIVVKYPRRNLFDFGFAHPRNFGSCFASGEWLIAIDSDELIIPENLQHFRETDPSETRTFFVHRRNYYRGEGLGVDNIPHLLAHGTFSEEAHCRIARNVPRIQWQGVIHEEIWDGEHNAFPTALASGVMLHHLSGFKEGASERDKQELYYYLTLKAVAFPRFRYGTGEYWFTDFTRANQAMLFDYADAFCDKNGLARISRELVQLRLG